MNEKIGPFDPGPFYVENILEDLNRYLQVHYMTDKIDGAAVVAIAHFLGYLIDENSRKIDKEKKDDALQKAFTQHAIEESKRY